MLNIIFSDVDGCIIGQGDASFNQIHTAINKLPSSFILVLTTGKTAHEIIQLNQYLELPGPFIVENGHGILFKNPSLLEREDFSFSKLKNPKICPSSFRKIFYGHFQTHEVFLTNEQTQNQELNSLQNLTEYTLLSLGGIKPEKSVLDTIVPSQWLLTNMDDDYLASLTGLSLEKTHLAKQRYFSEPIFIKNLNKSDLKNLKKQLLNRKIYYVQTSQFLHLTTKNLNKGRAIHYLLKVFFPKRDKTTFAIGDSLNDFSMFAQCNYNYYIQNQQIDNIPPNSQIIDEQELKGWLKSLSAITYNVGRIERNDVA